MTPLLATPTYAARAVSIAQQTRNGGRYTALVQTMFTFSRAAATQCARELRLRGYSRVWIEATAHPMLAYGRMPLRVYSLATKQEIHRRRCRCHRCKRTRSK